MKIVFLHVHGPVGAFRLGLPAHYLADAGHRVLLTHPGDGVAPETRDGLVRSADVVVTLNPGGRFEDRWDALKASKAAIVLDVDDDPWAWLEDPASRDPDVPANRGAIPSPAGDIPQRRWTPETLAEWETWLRGVDLVTTTTEHLAQVLRAHGAVNVSVCPNALLPAWKGPKRSRVIAPGSVMDRIRERPRGAPRAAPKRIGWTGSAHHKRDVAPVVAAMNRIALTDAGACLVGLGRVDWLAEGLRDDVPYSRILHVSVEVTDQRTGRVVDERWQAGAFPGILARQMLKTGEARAAVPFEQYFASLAAIKADVAVLPLRSDPFPLAKSSVTLLAWAAMGVPVVASRVGPYAEAERMGFPAVFVEHGDADAWAKAVRGLLYDPERAAELGDQAQAFAFQRYGFPDAVRFWEDAYESVVLKKDAEALA